MTPIEKPNWIKDLNDKIEIDPNNVCEVVFWVVASKQAGVSDAEMLAFIKKMQRNPETELEVYTEIVTQAYAQDPEYCKGIADDFAKGM